MTTPTNRSAGLRAGALAAAVLAVALLGACDRVGGLAPVTTVGGPDSAGGAVIVAKGDSVYTLSRRYNVPMRDLIAINHLKAPYALEVGQRLILPAARQIIVRKGDTLGSIAKMYNVPVSELTRINNLTPPYVVHVDQPLRLPGGGGETTVAAQPTGKGAPHGGGVQVSDLPPPASSPAASSTKPQGVPLPPPESEAPRAEPEAGKPTPPSAKAAPETAPPPAPEESAAKEEATPTGHGKGRFLWPVKGKLLSGFGSKPDGMHNDGINISAAKGTAVVAAADGNVAYAGNELRGFGNLLLIKHADGYITAYAHLDKLEVARGASIKRGQRIGTVGQSGSVTQPQLHFEVRKGSQVVDPRDFLGAPPQVSEAPSPVDQPSPG